MEYVHNITHEFNKYYVSPAPLIDKVYIDKNGLLINTITDFTDVLHDKCPNNIVGTK